MCVVGPVFSHFVLLIPHLALLHFTTLLFGVSFFLLLCFVAISLCRFVALSLCRSGAFRSVALSFCRSVVLSLDSFCRSVAIALSLYRSALSLCRSVILSLPLLCRCVALSFCHSVALSLRRSGTLVLYRFFAWRCYTALQRAIYYLT